MIGDIGDFNTYYIGFPLCGTCLNDLPRGETFSRLFYLTNFN